jgi:hypothetical protein
LWIGVLVLDNWLERFLLQPFVFKIEKTLLIYYVVNKCLQAYSGGMAKEAVSAEAVRRAEILAAA